MRTLLICTGLCLTAGTFVAAERLTTSQEETSALAMHNATQTALDKHKENAQAEFAAQVMALTTEKDSALARVNELTTTVQDITTAKDDLAAQVASAQTATETLRETMSQLQATNADLENQISESNTLLQSKEAELAALNAEIATYADGSEQTSASGEDTTALVTEVASLTELLAERDSVISTLQSQIETSANLAENGDASADPEVSAALNEELTEARALIEELTQRADQQTQASEASLAEINTRLSEREEQLANLQAELDAQQTKLDAQQTKLDAQQTKLDAQQAELDAQPTSIETVSATPDTSTASTEEFDALTAQLAELNGLVEEQTKTISNLRMGFEEEPDAMEMASVCIERASKIFELSQIKFGTGTSAISEESSTTLDHLRDLAIGCESEEMFIEIGGHTDSRGAESENQKLSEARANSVREFLIARGIPAETMVAVGFGETQPIATNDTSVGRAENRRITFTWKMREKEEETTDSIDG